MKILYLFIPALLLMFFSGCSDYVLIERNELITSNQQGELKIVCIDPRFYFNEDRQKYQLKTLLELTKKLKNDISNLSHKNKIDVKLFDLNKNANADYYYDLLSLKQNMLAANFNQQTPFNFSNRDKDYNHVQKKIFVYPPKISFNFSSFSKQFGTPYFSYIGIYELQDETLLYHIVVNTDIAETVYREYRSVKNGLSKDLVGQMIYDSYASLKYELTHKD